MLSIVLEAVAIPPIFILPPIPSDKMSNDDALWTSQALEKSVKSEDYAATLFKEEVTTILLAKQTD